MQRKWAFYPNSMEIDDNHELNNNLG
jgi:hypothetical protein